LFPLRPIFDTVPPSLGQWGLCVGVAALVLVVEQAIKLAHRLREPNS
jgi:hypothetical protein